MLAFFGLGTCCAIALHALMPYVREVQGGCGVYMSLYVIRSLNERSDE